MVLAAFTESDSHALRVVAKTSPEADQATRIMRALGLPDGPLPLVDDEMLFKYYRYLSENLSFPFTAYYPEPRTPSEGALCQCTVIRLLDPSKHLGDEFDGIFCKTAKAAFEVNLPLIELEVPQHAPNFQLIEDYWYWFWNWRYR